MKNHARFSAAVHMALLALLVTAGAPLPAVTPRDSTLFPELWLRDLEAQTAAVRADYADRGGALARRRLRLRQLLAGAPGTAACGRLLAEYAGVDDSLARLQTEAELQLLRLRYVKSIEMIRLLYEKILTMDHHFNSLAAHRQVLVISNPHEYGDFKAFRDVLEPRMKRRLGFALPAFMQSNPYLAAVFTVVGLAAGQDARHSRDQLDRIACILDFTVRMHGDLQVIHYENEYLRDANYTLKRECETLFAECTRVVGYHIALPACRDRDDWERLFALLDAYLARRLAALTAANAPPPLLGAASPSVHLQFAVDRVVSYVEKYTAFVAQGNEYYKKFGKIAGGYANEKLCAEGLPASFRGLQADIDATLDKFNTAYILPELQGSRLRELLYGPVE
jgi:hypothetical protein